jgi:hypothetical protein
VGGPDQHLAEPLGRAGRGAVDEAELAGPGQVEGGRALRGEQLEAEGVGQAVGVLLRRAGDDEAALCKDMLVLDVGEGVARARGRYGTEMSEDDARAVALAAQLLGTERYPVDDL